MKNKASVFLKRIVALLSSIAKAKSLAVKNKTSTLKARAIMFSLVKSKRVLMGSISNKIHSILGQLDKESEYGDEEDQSKAIVLYCNGRANQSNSSCTQLADDNCNNDYNYYDDDDDKYPDLRHCLFDEEEDFDDPGGSIIDLVKNSKEEGEDFSLEDEIDHVADLFISRFHKQMRLQKLESFKRYQEMLARSV
ncbi:hypothetical protein Tsubulata_000726 [Turnera subulata]|uniref:DUF761 domain-containing protein n=1 Tax=Turnera subulata TaxID=218843 RepID=A0A9Q0J2L7_9ROSI|nr:hypothetical protein Tsubulata_000726 [Turnera subulata]